MGLATAHQLASYLGGALELRDTSNKGSTFELSLPLLAPMDANAEGVSLDDTPDSQLGFAFPLRILVCDPDDGHNHIIAHHLRSLGYSATFTASYNASFGELARQQFDLGLFDVGHRVVVHGLREIFRKDRPDPPAFTAAMVNESVATAQSSTKDFDLRLGKPLRESDLVTLIRTALRSKFFAETDSR